MSLRRTACVADDQAAGVAGFSSAVATCGELVLSHRLPPFWQSPAFSSSPCLSPSLSKESNAGKKGVGS